MVKSYRQVASIIRVRGVKGEAEVQDIDGLLSRLPAGIELWLVPPTASGPRQTRIETMRESASGIWVTLAGIEDRDTAAPLIGRFLLAAEDELLPEPPPDESTTFADQEAQDPGLSPEKPTMPPEALGLLVNDITHGFIGSIVEVSDISPQTVWIVEGPFGDVMIPAVEAFVRSWDKTAVIVDLPRGLLELNK